LELLIDSIAVQPERYLLIPQEERGMGNWSYSHIVFFPDSLCRPATIPVIPGPGNIFSNKEGCPRKLCLETFFTNSSEVLN